MAVKCTAEITIIDQTDATALVMWYRLSTSATKPAKPTTTDATATPTGWSKAEPSVDTTTTTYLYTSLQTVWGDGSCTWGDVQLDSAYESAKAAYNAAIASGETASTAMQAAQEAQAAATLTRTSDGSTAGPISSLTAEGWAEQDGTPTPSSPVEIQVARGRNLLDADSVRSASFETHGYTITYEGDGWWRVHGTTSSSGGAVTLYGDPTYAEPLNELVTSIGVTYTLSVEVEGTPFVSGDAYTNSTHLVMYGASASKNTRAGGYAPLVVTSTTYNERVSCFKYYYGANVPDGVVLDGRFRIQLERDSVAHPYVPYGHVGLDVKGRNLLDPAKSARVDSPQTIRGITVTYEGDGWFRATGTYASTSGTGITLWTSPQGDYNAPVNGEVPQEGGVTVALTVETEGTPFVEGSTYATSTHIVFYGSSASVNIRLCGFADSVSVATPSSYISCVKYYVGANVAVGTQVNGRFRVMLAVGETLTPYEPYHHETIPIPLPAKGFAASLPDGTHDTLTLDGAGGYVWQNETAEVTFDGSSDEMWGIDTTDNSEKRRSVIVLNGSVKPLSTDVGGKALCDYFALVANGTTNTSTTVGFTVASNGNLYIGHGGTYNTASDWRSFLSTHPVTILYPLATPTTESGYVDLPEIPVGASIRVPELENLGVEYFTSDATARATKAWGDRALTESDAAVSSLAPYVVGTQTANTRWWQGTCAELTELKDGQQIVYWLPYATASSAPNSAPSGTVTPAETGTSNLSYVWLRLTLKGGTDTGWVPCYYNGTTRLTTHYGASNVVRLTYRDGGWWSDANYYANNIDRLQYAVAVAASAAISAGRIAVFGVDGKLHLLDTTPFDLTKPPLYVGTAYSATDATNATTRTSNYVAWGSAFNLTNTHAITSAAAGKAVYIVGTIDGTTFTPYSTVLTCNPATVANGLYYMRLGVMSTAANAVLEPEHPLYAYVGGRFQRLDKATYDMTPKTGTCSHEVNVSTPTATVTCPGFALVPGAQVVVDFSNRGIVYNDTTVRLNVNSTGAKDVWVAGAVTSSANQLRWGAGATIRFAYDGAKYVVVGEPRTWYGASNTAAGTQTKTDTTAVTGIVICKGATANMRMLYANTATAPTLNVQGTGAINIYSEGATLAAGSALSWSANATVPFVFNGSGWEYDSNAARKAAAAYSHATDAAKTATNYIGIDSTGIRVAATNPPESATTYQHLTSTDLEFVVNGLSELSMGVDLNSKAIVRVGQATEGHVVVDADGMEVFDGSDSLAAFGTTTRIGKASDFHVDASTGAIDMSYGSSSYFHAGYGTVYYKDSNGSVVSTSGTFVTIGTRKATASVGRQSVAIGMNNEASRYLSVAIGDACIASGDDGAVAVGKGTGATGDNGAFACGWLSQANGKASCANGYLTQASGNYSHASGLGTQASYEGQFACGKYNSPQSDDLFEVGKGTSSSRSNAFRVTSGAVAYVGSTQVTSDGRVKTGIADLDQETATEFVRALRPRSYEKFGIPELGFVAQEVEGTEYAGYVVGTEDNHGYEDFRTLNYNALIAPLVAALQRALDHIDRLEARIQELEDR